MEKEKATLAFVDCTEVFPIEDGDQIVDVAAGYFYTVVVTEYGSAFAVGHDRARVDYSYEGGEQVWQERRPAYQIDLPGRATKCWAHQHQSIAWIEVEEDSGGRKYYAGCEFVDHYCGEQMSMMGVP